MKKLLFILSISFSAIFAEAQSTFHGIDRNPCKEISDSIVLENINELYFKGAIQSKWWEDLHTNFPLMETAWRYCIERCPEQRSLYVDGTLLAKTMISHSETEADSTKYFNLLMEVYDMRLKNLDLINANLRKASLKASSGSLMMNRLNDWVNLFNPRQKYKDEQEYYVMMYEKYLPIIKHIKGQVDDGVDIGGDVQPLNLQDFFVAAANNYVKTYNLSSNDEARKQAMEDVRNQAKEEEAAQRAWYKAQSDTLKIIRKNLNLQDAEAVAAYNERNTDLKIAADSIMELISQIHQRRDSVLAAMRETGDAPIRAAKQLIIDEYNVLREIIDAQKSSLGKDFKPDLTLSEEEQQLKIDSAIAIVAQPYDEVIEFCQNTLKNNLNIDLGESSLADLDMKYYDELESHKDSLQWLYVLKVKCESAADFTMTDPFYMEVDKLFNACYEKNQGSRGSLGSRGSVYYTQAKEALQKAAATKDPNQQLNFYTQTVNYLKQAKADDPGNAKKYDAGIKQLQSTISQLREYVQKLAKQKAEEEFWKKGK